MYFITLFFSYSSVKWYKVVKISSSYNVRVVITSSNNNTIWKFIILKWVVLHHEHCTLVFDFNTFILKNEYLNAWLLLVFCTAVLLHYLEWLQVWVLLSLFSVHLLNRTIPSDRHQAGQTGRTYCPRGRVLMLMQSWSRTAPFTP